MSAIAGVSFFCPGSVESRPAPPLREPGRRGGPPLPVSRGAEGRRPRTPPPARLRRRRLRGARPPPAASPRLVETVFKARLHEDAGRRGEAYLSGSASWTILNPASPGVLKLAPLTLALQKTRFENRDALAGDFDG